MRLAGHQPNYLPNLAFFSKMKQADCFILSTNLKFQRDKEWHRRNRIPGDRGDLWLTVPVKGDSNQMIREVLVNNDLPWRYKHQSTLQVRYGNAEGAELLPDILALYDHAFERLADLNVAFIRLLAARLAITTPIHIDEATTGRKAGLIVNTCKRWGADHYLSGAGGRHYIDESYCQTLRDHGIRYSFQEDTLSKKYPYSAVHYVLAYGPERVQSLI